MRKFENDQKQTAQIDFNKIMGNFKKSRSPNNDNDFKYTLSKSEIFRLNFRNWSVVSECKA